jgi:hypothetical protein
MKDILILSWSFMALTSSTCLAQTIETTSPIQPQSSASSSWETIKVIKGKSPSLFEQSHEAGGYQLVRLTYSQKSSGLAIYGANNKNQDIVKYRVIDLSTQAFVRAKCNLTSKGKSIFGFEITNGAQAYSCQFENKKPNEFALGILIPKRTTYGSGLTSVEVTESKPGEEKDSRKVKLIYKGLIYTAFPNDVKIPPNGAPSILGYEIQSEEKKIGSVRFEKDGIIEAPMSDSPDREAVIFLAFSLLSFPDPDQDKLMKLFQ